MKYVYILSKPSLWTVGFYDPDNKWQAESDHSDPEKAARRVRFLNGGEDAEAGHWHWAVSPGIRACGNDDPGSASTDKISRVTCWECLRLKALALAPLGMGVSEAIEKIRNAESLKGRRRTIDMEIVIHDESVEVSFSVWAGNRDYKGATLENAVNSCLVANKEFSGTTEEAERVVQEAMAYQERL